MELIITISCINNASLYWLFPLSYSLDLINIVFVIPNGDAQEYSIRRRAATYVPIHTQFDTLKDCFTRLRFLGYDPKRTR